MLHLEVLRKSLDKLYHKLHVISAVEARFGVHAVVAVMTVVVRIVFPKVIEQQLSAAFSGFGVSHGFHKQLTADFLLRYRLALHEFFQLADVFVAVISYASALQAIASGTSGFLIIAFNALGNVIVDYEPDIRFVNAHTKGDGGHNHTGFFHQEGILVLCTDLGIQAGVVRKCGDAVDNQQLGQLLYLFAAEAIDDSGFSGILFDIADNILFRLYLVPYFVVKIRSVERRFEYLCILNTQVLEDVALNLWRSRCREGDYGCGMDFIHDSPDAPVFRAEVVAPFRDTVGLVYRIERDVELFKEGDVLFFCEGFRSYVKQFCAAFQEVFLHSGYLCLVEG